MQIKKIIKNKKDYKIILDNGLSFKTYDDVLLNNNLLYEKDLSKEDLDKITEQTKYYDIYYKVVNLINLRLRSEYEVRVYLKNKTDNDTIEKIISSLKKINLINDYNYAKAYFNDKVNLSLDGPIKIKKHLQENKIDENIIEEVVIFPKELMDSRLDKIISKKIKSNTKSEYLFKNKMMSYLVNLGYYKSDIISHLNNIHLDIDCAKEMDKIYNKLKDKYSSKELIYKLKNKLYTKGYKMDDINNYIAKKEL